MKVPSKKPNSNNDKNTTATNNINDPVKNITNNGNNIGSSITNIDLASVSIELSATDFEMQERSRAGEPQLSQIETTGENTKSLERTAENNPTEPLDEPSEIETARQNTKSIESEEENNPGESSSGERVPETISKKSSKETNKKCNTEDSPKFKEKILLLQKHFEWFEYRFGEGAYCSTCRTCALPSEEVKFWASKPRNIIKDDKACISCKNHGRSMRHKQNNKIVKLLKKWKAKGKGTVRNKIIEGNAKILENKRLRNRQIIKKVIKSVYFMTKKHWAARRNQK